ncbi:MAG: response regulator [Gemmatimonadaceae bacterium]|nr:response regulator [Gemmatimonadaceae bacterium]
MLIVDDEETIRTALARFLRTRGYEVEVAESGIAALVMLERQRFMVIVCDIRMPGMTGLEVVPEALQLDADLAILMLSAVNDAPTATDALSHGAMDYLVKPIELIDLQAAVERSTHRRQLEIERRRVELHVREEVATRTSELEKEKAALHALTIGVAETLINAMDAKDVYLRGHSSRVADQAASIAEEMGLDADIVENVRLAGRLHDVGKIGIRDGGGYPRGLAGDQITIGGRILAACDAFDALTSRRAFREAMDRRETIAYLEQNELGRLLDPDVFMALKKVVLRRKTLTFIDDLHA